MQIEDNHFSSEVFSNLARLVRLYGEKEPGFKKSLILTLKKDDRVITISKAFTQLANYNLVKIRIYSSSKNIRDHFQNYDIWLNHKLFLNSDNKLYFFSFDMQESTNSLIKDACRQLKFAHNEVKGFDEDTLKIKKLLKINNDSE